MKLQKYILFLITFAIFTLIPSFLLPKTYAASTPPGCNTLNPNPSSCVTAPNNNIIDYGSCTGAIGNDRATCCKGNICSDKIISNPSSPEPSLGPSPDIQAPSPSPCPQSNSSFFRFPVANAEGRLIAPAIKPILNPPCGFGESPTPVSVGPGIPSPTPCPQANSGFISVAYASTNPCYDQINNNPNNGNIGPGCSISSGSPDCPTNVNYDCQNGKLDNGICYYPPAPEEQFQVAPDYNPYQGLQEQCGFNNELGYDPCYLTPAPDETTPPDTNIAPGECPYYDHPEYCDNGYQGGGDPQPDQTENPPQDNNQTIEECPYYDHPEYCDQSGTPDNSQPPSNQNQYKAPPADNPPPPQSAGPDCANDPQLEKCDGEYQAPAPEDSSPRPDTNTAPGECPYYDNPEYC